MDQAFRERDERDRNRDKKTRRGWEEDHPQRAMFSRPGGGRPAEVSSLTNTLKIASASAPSADCSWTPAAPPLS
jgi:hypothetical protein